jgi:hypothetical protein
MSQAVPALEFVGFPGNNPQKFVKLPTKKFGVPRVGTKSPTPGSGVSVRNVSVAVLKSKMKSAFAEWPNRRKSVAMSAVSEARMAYIPLYDRTRELVGVLASQSRYCISKKRTERKCF